MTYINPRDCSTVCAVVGPTTAATQLAKKTNKQVPGYQVRALQGGCTRTATQRQLLHAVLLQRCTRVCHTGVLTRVCPEYSYPGNSVVARVPYM